MITGDFLSFEFDGVKSEDLGIVRTSEGDRYEETLQPEVRDVTVEVPGMHGEYYFGSTYGNKTISISFAFDSLTETQFRKLRTTFGTGHMGKLILDERPYKYYMAKIESPIELSYVCFDEPKKAEGSERDGVRRITIEEAGTATTDVIVILAGQTTEYVLPKQVQNGTNPILNTQNDSVVMSFNRETNTCSIVNNGETNVGITITYDYEAIRDWEQVTPWVYTDQIERIYKGEGKIDFICYYPFAKHTFKYLDNTTKNSQWAESSRMLTPEERDPQQQGGRIYDQFIPGTEPVYKDHYGYFNVYNAGDKPTGFRLLCVGDVFSNYFFDGEDGFRIHYNRVIENGEVLVNNYDDVLKLKLDITLKTGDIGIMIDTDSALIYGIRSVGLDSAGNRTYTYSTNIYNEYIKAGNFFKINTHNKGQLGKIYLRGTKNGNIPDENGVVKFEWISDGANTITLPNPVTENNTPLVYRKDCIVSSISINNNQGHVTLSEDVAANDKIIASYISLQGNKCLDTFVSTEGALNQFDLTQKIESSDACKLVVYYADRNTQLGYTISESRTTITLNESVDVLCPVIVEYTVTNRNQNFIELHYNYLYF